MLANEYCTETKKVYGRGEYINSNGLWKTNSSYGNANNVPINRCTIHQADGKTSIDILNN